CGVGPIMALMVLASKLNKRKVTLLKYATSGDITGDKSAVVGYASIIFE
ncbi:MAG TPA: AmmeMemoRadiSam system protein B, partial [Thermoprotei archaeon]|nr:AmmeMemoRadiSam system protein B [Thermoprotei archaeon]